MISHDHYDHVDYETLIKLKDKTKKENHHDLKNGILCLKGGDLTEELENFPNAEQYPISEYFNDEFFETKKVVYLDLPKDDPKQRKPDITKARTILGWEPKVERAEGLKITYDYFKSLPAEALVNTEHKDFTTYNK